MLLYQLTYGHAAQIHVRFGLGQQHFLLRNHGSACQRAALAIGYPHPVLIGDAVDCHKSHVVRRELVFDPGITQTDNHFHARSFATLRMTARGSEAAESAVISSLSSLPSRV